MKVILTGGSGLIGDNLSRVLIERGHDVIHLGRWHTNNRTHKKDFTSTKNIFWSNPEVLEGADAVIHLAGANVAKPWTTSYKKIILESRTIGTQALLEACKNCTNPPKHIISASGIGYYPEGWPSILTEDSEPGENFLAQVCKSWEASLNSVEANAFKISIVRTGLVLSNRSKIIGAARTQFYLSGMVGSVGSRANNWSWIHINDLTQLYVGLLEGALQPGIYNGVAPNPCSQGEFGYAYERHPNFQFPNWLFYARIQWYVARGLNRMLRILSIRWRPVIPAWLIRLAWGERSAIALTNQKVSANKTLAQGFCYQYPNIDVALQHLQANPEI